jgi:hypothetical protein
MALSAPEGRWRELAAFSFVRRNRIRSPYLSFTIERVRLPPKAHHPETLSTLQARPVPSRRAFHDREPFQI